MASGKDRSPQIPAGGALISLILPALLSCLLPPEAAVGWRMLPLIIRAASLPGRRFSCKKPISTPMSKKVKVAQSFPTLCDPMDYTVHGILQARILEWVAFPFSRRSSQPRYRTQVSHIAGGFFTS